MQKITKGSGEFTKPGYVTDDAFFREQLAQSFVRKALHSDVSEQISELIRNAKVTKVFRQTKVYLMYSGFYEKRTIGEECVPSVKVPGESDHKRFKSEFHQWDFQLPTKIKPFQSAHHKIIVPGSRHINNCTQCGTSGSFPCSCRNGYETCYSCGGQGDVHCDSCGGNGYERCYSCGGSGSIRCNSCGGSGAERCGHCGGRGTVTKTITNYNPQNVAETIYVEESCFHCGGRGTVTCGSCGGNGSFSCGSCGGRGEQTCSRCGGARYVTCGTCGGRRELICSRCGGSTKVTCYSCSGGGYLMDQVYVEQQLDSHGIYDILFAEDKLPGKYTASVGDPTPSNEDRCVIRVEDDEPIHSITNEKLFEGGSLNIDHILERLMKKIPEDENVHYHNFEVEIRERDIFDIFYMFGSREYRLRVDPITETICLERDPCKDYVSSLITEMEKDLAAKRWKNLKQNLAEYDDIFLTSEEPEDARVTAVRKQYKKHLKARIVAAVLIVIAAFLIYKLLKAVALRFLPLWIILKSLF